MHQIEIEWNVTNPLDESGFSISARSAFAPLLSEAEQQALETAQQHLAENVRQLRAVDTRTWQERVEEAHQAYERNVPGVIQFGLDWVDPGTWALGGLLGKGAGGAARGVSALGQEVSKFPVLLSNARKLKAATTAFREVGMLEEAADLERAVKVAGFSSREASVLLREAEKLAAPMKAAGPQLVAPTRAENLLELDELRRDLARVSRTPYEGGWSKTLAEIAGRKVANPPDLTDTELNNVLISLRARAEGVPRTKPDPLARFLASKAAPFRHLDYTWENWIKEFGEKQTVRTPIGELPFRADQFAKLEERGRTEFFGLIKPTLEEPLLVVKDEREGYLFVKPFVSERRGIYFVSVSENNNGIRVIVSNSERALDQIIAKVRRGSLLWPK